MWLLRERLSDFRENNLTAQEWNTFYIDVIVLYVYLKIAVIFDHSRLGLKNKFFPNKMTQLHPSTLPLLYKVNS